MSEQEILLMPLGDGRQGVQSLAGSGMDSLTERATAWTKNAMQRAVVAQVPEHDLFSARVPALRKCYAVEATESGALANLERQLVQYAKQKLIQGVPLPLFVSAIQPAPAVVKGIVRINRLGHELKKRSRDWGGNKKQLPKGAIDAVCLDFDALISRHAAALGLNR